MLVQQEQGPLAVVRAQQCEEPIGCILLRPFLPSLVTPTQGISHFRVCQLQDRRCLLVDDRLLDRILQRRQAATGA